MFFNINKYLTISEKINLDFIEPKMFGKHFELLSPIRWSDFTLLLVHPTFSRFSKQPNNKFQSKFINRNMFWSSRPTIGKQRDKSFLTLWYSQSHGKTLTFCKFVKEIDSKLVFFFFFPPSQGLCLTIFSLHYIVSFHNTLSGKWDSGLHIVET